MRTFNPPARILAIFCLLLASVLMGEGTAPAVEVGEPAPAFSLTSNLGKKISLSQFKGKKSVLIQFYTTDFNPTWIANLQARMVDQRKFEKRNIQILAISADTPYSQKMFAASMELTYPILSDHPDLSTIQEFDVLMHIGKRKRPVARGSFFFIDTKGIVRGKWMGKRGETFPSETIFTEISEFLKWAYEDPMGEEDNRAQYN